MLLRRLEIKNIRSYHEAVVDFSSGTTLLAGDIGSGKSTLLLAIEFALFGASRSELPAEALLRKGTTEAQVQLQFLLGEHEYSITRRLKKEKDSVKQLPGEFAQNGVVKELTPVELKAAVVQLLGYPDEFITKNKNFLFRFTVYTPQEAMRLVLEESPESRLNLLRKVFALDKYKIIRENAELVLKELRVERTVLETRIEPLQQKKELFHEVKKQLEQIENISVERQKQLKQLQSLLLEKEKSVAEQEKQLVWQRELMQEQQHLLQSTERIEKIIAEEKKKSEEIDQELELLNSLGDVKTLSTEVSQLQKQQQEVMIKKNTLTLKISQVQEAITLKQQEVVECGKRKEEEQRLSTLITQGNEDLKKLPQLQEKKVSLEQLFQQTMTLLTKNATLQEHAQSVKNRLHDLATCPTCLQEVSETHKGSVVAQEEEKIERLTALLLQLETKKKAILQQKEELLAEEKILEEKRQQVRIWETQLLAVQEKSQTKETLTDQVRSLVQQNNALQQEVSELPEVKLIEISLKEKQNLLTQATKRDFLIKQKSSAEQTIVRQKEELATIHERLTVVAEQLKELPEMKEEILKKQEQVKQLREQVQQSSMHFAREEERKKQRSEEAHTLEKEIITLQKWEGQLVSLKEKYHWLSAHFIPLSVTIEKHVLAKIYHVFNQLFQEWFTLLIEDDGFSAYLDDAFTPIIIQQGYEISFSHLSGGERTSAALAYRLALNKVINDLVGTIQTKDLLILDEPTDGFSAQQLDKVRDVLERLALEQIILVSHEAKVESFVQQVIRVEKSHGISRISV